MWTLQRAQKKLVESILIYQCQSNRTDNHFVLSQMLHLGNSFLGVNGRLILPFLLNALRFNFHFLMQCQCWKFCSKTYLSGCRLLSHFHFFSFSLSLPVCTFTCQVADCCPKVTLSSNGVASSSFPQLMGEYRYNSNSLFLKLFGWPGDHFHLRLVWGRYWTVALPTA